LINPVTSRVNPPESPFSKGDGDEEKLPAPEVEEEHRRQAFFSGQRAYQYFIVILEHLESSEYAVLRPLFIETKIKIKP